MKKNRETIDIESLLIRAYREKQVHKLKLNAGNMLGLTPPRAPGATFSAEDKVDTSSFACRMAAQLRELQARLGAAPSTLIDLHDAVLSLPDFYVERGAGLDFVVWDEETASAAGHRIIVEGDRGSYIARVAPRGGRRREVEALIEIAPRRAVVPIVTAPLLVLSGQYGDRPFVPDVVETRRVPVYRGARKEAAEYRPEYETPLHAVVEARAAYAVWHAALGMLAEAFAGSAEYEVTGPSAPASPWELSPRILLAIEKAEKADEDAPANDAIVPCKKKEKSNDAKAMTSKTNAKPARRKRVLVPRKNEETAIVAMG